MIIIYFVNGLCFGGLGLAAYLQYRQGGDFALKKQLPWLAFFGFASGVTSWIDMFLLSGDIAGYAPVLDIIRMGAQIASGLLLLRFGWGILIELTPLPSWSILLPGILIVPISYVIAYAFTTFITPSPIEIPVDIWSRYLLYLPGSIMAGIGFLRQSIVHKRQGLGDVANLMLGTGIAFLLEAFVVGLVVPAAPYGPASYYNYDRVIQNAFAGEHSTLSASYNPMVSWLDYQSVLDVTGLPIQFWRMVSAITVTFFMVRGLGVFEAVRKRQLKELEDERDRAQKAIFDAHSIARQTAENWTNALVSINRRITELDDVDNILIYIIERARDLLKSDFVGLALLSDDYFTLNLKCYSRADGTELVDTPPVTVSNPLILKALQTAGTYRSASDEPSEKLDGACFGLNGARAIGVVSLALDDRPIGTLWMARCDQNPYSETDLIWLECMADQVVIAIQHGLMTSHLQSLSITEERARIAREMHDGLAQVLGYLNLEVQTLEALLRQGKQKSLEDELAQMRDAIRVANADVRENILSLRTTLSNKKGLISAVDEYLREFSIQTGIETHFENQLKDDLVLASLAEVQLVCILQESLANIRKHAQAGHVTVLIAKDRTGSSDSICMRVADNGIGFVVHDAGRRFGLQIMKERATSVHGTLSVQSLPGQGTTIECKLPCLSRERIKKERRLPPVQLDLPSHDQG